MNRLAWATCVCAGAMALALPPWSGEAAGQRKAARKAAGKAPGWEKLLTPPAAKAERLPAAWKVVPIPKGLQKSQGGGSGLDGFVGELSETADEMVRESEIVVVGVGVGNDGGFYPEPRLKIQYTTYYLRVTGYLKDKTGRRAPFLKILAPGGFRDGGQVAPDAPRPYLEEGRRYLLYLKQNRGLPWGFHGTTQSPIGRGDEYWVSAMGGGRWWEEDGRLVGVVDPPTHWGLRYRVGVDPYPSHLPIAAALRHITQAAERERRGVPLPARSR